MTVVDLARRRRALGHADRLAAAVPAAAPRLRSGDIVGAVRRDAGRRDRAGDLLLGRAGRPARHVAVARGFRPSHSPTPSLAGTLTPRSAPVARFAALARAV